MYLHAIVEAIDFTMRLYYLCSSISRDYPVVHSQFTVLARQIVKIDEISGRFWNSGRDARRGAGTVIQEG